MFDRYAEAGFGDNEVSPERLDALANGGVNVYIRNYLICRMTGNDEVCVKFRSSFVSTCSYDMSAAVV